jgi:hypothetical protein
MYCRIFRVYNMCCGLQFLGWVKSVVSAYTVLAEEGLRSVVLLTYWATVLMTCNVCTYTILCVYGLDSHTQHRFLPYTVSILDYRTTADIS